MNLFRPRHRHGDVLEIAGARVTLKANPRARRVSIRITGAGEVTATAPSERRLGEAADFARSRAGWIAQRLAARPAPMLFTPAGQVLLRGATVRLDRVAGASAARLVEVEGRPVIRSGGEGEAFSRRVQALLQREARRDLEARTFAHCATLGLAPPKVGLGDPKSRWGSCTPGRASLRYSWRLIMAPPFVLDYVAAHEVAHLVHADHSPRFWAVVHGLVGDERKPRAWLRAHGASLHAMGRGAQ